MVSIAHASIDENGKIKDGKAGDQTGKEICIRSWYNKPWSCVIRFKDPVRAEKVAECMEYVVFNENIGYDQNQRNTLLREAKKVKWRISAINTPCECDCSSLVTIACIYAGIPESSLVMNGNCATTRTLRQLLSRTGLVDVLYSIEYTTKPDNLQRGDIILSEGHHVAVVVLVDDIPKKPVKEVAKEVLAGKWGNGAERKEKLKKFGYNYDEVQKEVTALIHGQKQTTAKETDTAQYIWNYLIKRIKNAYGVAGLMGNLKAESRLNPKNMENSYEKKLNMNDDSYTFCVDTGTYTKFCTDKVGYGIAQWTSEVRKTALYQSKGQRYISDLDMQLEFLWKELNTSYKNVLNVLQKATSIQEASDMVLTKFERPKDQSQSVKNYRASLGKELYDNCNRNT